MLFFLLFAPALCTPLPADARGALLLSGTLSAGTLARAAADALATLPRALIAPAHRRAMRVDVRAAALMENEDDHQVRAVLRDGGNELVLVAGERAAAVPLPETADLRFVPAVRRARGGRLVVRVRTLRAGMVACAGDKECLRALAVLHCGDEKECLARGKAYSHVAVAARLLYRVLFAALTMAQIVVVGWGAAFALSVFVVQAGHAAEKICRQVGERAALAWTRAVSTFGVRIVDDTEMEEQLRCEVTT